jgi:inositol polyphosphate-4-phosphatase
MSNMVVRMMHGAYVMSCKSAKDRTSMGVTYQQAIMLSVYHQVGNFHTLTIAELMRRHGVRRLNAEKNIGIPKYAFSSFQAPFLPKELQPPPGTGGGGFTS